MVSSWSTDLGQILHYGVYVLLGIVCLGAIVRVLWAPMDIHSAPCCGGCGHGVRDILQGVCPECGGQYAKVGITTPSMAVRLRASLPIALLAWTTIMGLGAALSYGWLEQRAWASFSSTSVAFTPGFGGKQQERYTTELTPATFGQVTTTGHAEALAFRIGIVLDYVTDSDKVESGTCVMRLRRNGESDSFPLTIDLADGGFTIKDGQGKEIAKGPNVEKLDEAIVEKWFKQAGLETESIGVKRSMKDAARVARFARTDPSAIETGLSHGIAHDDTGALQSSGATRSIGGVPTSFTTSPAMIGPSGIGTTDMALWVGLLGLTYIVGCAGIVWRNRRVIRG